MAACLLLISAAACNSANPPQGQSEVPDSAAAGMTNTDNHRTVYPPPGTQDSLPNQSMISADTSMRDTRNHFVDTQKSKSNTSK